MSLVAALVEIEKVSKTHAAEIADIPDDMEVKALEVEMEKHDKAMLKATEWSRVRITI